MTQAKTVLLTKAKPVTKSMVRGWYEMESNDNPGTSFPYVVSIIEANLGCSYEFIVDVLTEGH